MYADNTLTPKEAIRMCALGTLAVAPLRYSVLVNSIRNFVSHILGPSLDVMGPSIELLRYEGLVVPIDGIGMEDDAELAITEAGHQELRNLLTANIRSAATELNKLIIALKFRFLHLLEKDDRCIQTDLLYEVCENELARLDDLRQHHEEEGGFLLQWLDHDISLLESRLNWLSDFRNAIYSQTSAQS